MNTAPAAAEGASTGSPQTTTIIVQPAEVGVGSRAIDLLQVYPSKTNNLDFQTYVDNVNESLFCQGCSIPLTSTMEFMRGILIVMLIILTLGMALIFVELGYYSWYFVLQGMMLISGSIFGVVSVKVYLLYQSHIYLKYYRTRSLDFHEYGMKLYYGLFTDMTISFLASFYWIVLLVHYCIFENSTSCQYATSFDSFLSGTITWLFCVPLFIYTILGMLRFFLFVLTFNL